VPFVAISSCTASPTDSNLCPSYSIDDSCPGWSDSETITLDHHITPGIGGGLNNDCLISSQPLPLFMNSNQVSLNSSFTNHPNHDDFSIQIQLNPLGIFLGDGLDDTQIFESQQQTHCESNHHTKLKPSAQTIRSKLNQIQLLSRPSVSTGSKKTHLNAIKKHHIFILSQTTYQEPTGLSTIFDAMFKVPKS